MKFNTGSLPGAVTKRSSLTIYTNTDEEERGEDLKEKMTASESEIVSIRKELETVQKALKAQTKRCRQLVAEYTKRLQDKEHQYQSERTLRNDQLAKVLRALLIFEARLKQEQKFISHQLEEKDYLIEKQRKEISGLMSNQFCKHCNQFYSPISHVESFDSSSDYVVTDYQDYQSSTMESLDSSSETYATVSETDYRKNRGRRRKPYFDRDNSPETYENVDQSESIEEEISNVSDRIESIFTSNYSSNESDCNNTVIQQNIEKPVSPRISETILVFQNDDQETNDKWYASGSDQEIEEQRDVYRNNPVLECMNQILLHNINDAINSPPKTPNVERKGVKKVKFSDQEDEKDQKSSDYYETPVQKQPNFYETPQSIYSNDYEQIITKNSQEKEVNILPTKRLSVPKEPETNYYDMDTSKPSVNLEVVRKPKILRTPPALPPKPTNLVSKYKLNVNKSSSESTESEPDYCTISELNVPLKNIKHTINVVTEIDASNNPDHSKDIVIHKPKNPESNESEYDPVDVNEEIANLVSKKIEKFSIQLAKQTPIKTENNSDIPKLPQVSEIIIPEETESSKTDEESIGNDNYVKNNTQILKIKNNNRRPIVMGTSVSSLITGFNNQQLLSEIQNKPIKKKLSPDPPIVKTKSEEFDLSQTFEEFKLEDCEILEEYDIDSKSDKSDKSDQKSGDAESTYSSLTRVELVRATTDSTTFDTNRRKSDLVGDFKTGSARPTRNGTEPTYEHFLECTGLSTKSILTPSRLLSNHKSVLKPKDVKLRSKVKSTSVFERHGSTIKYWSEPYI